MILFVWWVEDKPACGRQAPTLAIALSEHLQWRKENGFELLFLVRFSKILFT
jgi:hypothetical protein